LLRLGDRGALNLFAPALTNEANSFARQKVCKLLACFHLDVLPPIVRSWVTEMPEHNDVETSLNWAYRLAAIEAARSWATRDALRDLLQCGFTLHWLASQQSADAVAELAVRLTRGGDRTVVSLLTDILDAGSRAAQSTLAAYGLEALSAVGQGLVGADVAP